MVDARVEYDSVLGTPWQVGRAGSKLGAFSDIFRLE